MKKYLLVGAGLYNAVIYQRLIHEFGVNPLDITIIEKREHLGGNCYTEKIDGLTEIPLSKMQRIKNSLITCIVRDNNVIIPSGNDVIEKGDRVIVLVTGSIKNIKDILA